MTRIRLLALFALGALLAPEGAQAQRGDTPRPSGASPAPLAISGNPSSGRHCVSGAAANVHSLGWLTAGTGYTITFDSEIGLLASVGRMDLEEDEAIAVHGSPDLSFTASSAGTMALFVSGNGRAGCYRYKVQIDTTTALAQSARTTALPQLLTRAAKATPRSLAIRGAASGAKQCLSGNGAARAHALGYADEGSIVRVTFSSDFDPIAGVLIVDPIGQRGSYLIDDDSGGNAEPEISFTSSRSGNLVLFVAGYAGSTGCYRLQSSIEAANGGDAPITIAEVAAPLAEAIASEIALALESGTISELTVNSQGIRPLAVASRRCRRAGSVSIRGVTVSGNRYTMSPGATATFVGCTFLAGRRTVAINAALALTGQWCRSQGTGTCSRVEISGAVPYPGGSAVVAGPIEIGSYAITVTGAGLQQGAPDTQPPPSPNTCPATLSSTAVTVGASATAFTITVPVGATCPWTASSSAGWVTGSASLTGPGAVTFSVAANTGALRRGTVTVNGQSVTVTQSAGTITPPPATGRFDGTYDYSFVFPVGAGQTSTSRFTQSWIVSNGRISLSVDNRVTGTVNSTSGAVVFTQPCWHASGGTATFTGTLVVGPPKSGSGSYTCQNGFAGGTWRVDNGR